MKNTALAQQPAHWWKKGQSGNPHGRPKRGDTMAEYLRQATAQDIAGVPTRRLIAEMLVLLALGALDPRIRLQAIAMIIDYTDGRPPTRIQNAVDELGEVIPLRIVPG